MKLRLSLRGSLRQNGAGILAATRATGTTHMRTRASDQCVLMSRACLLSCARNLPVVPVDQVDNKSNKGNWRSHCRSQRRSALFSADVLTIVPEINSKTRSVNE